MPAAALLVSLALLPGCREDPTTVGQPLSPELEEVMREVAELRGLPRADGIRAATVPAHQLPDRLEDALTPADLAAFDQLTLLYHLLGFLPADETYLSAYRDFAGQRIAGFYSPADKTLWINSSEPSVTFDRFEDWQRTTTAHEFVHAIQDQAFGLASFPERTDGNLDWALALNAVVEGDAVVHERLWAREHATEPGRHAEQPLARMPYASVPAAIQRELEFPYTSGFEWASTVRASRGNEAINNVLAGRQLTTSEILHPERFESGWTPRPVVLPDLRAGLGEPWELASRGTLGEFQLRNLLQLHLAGLPSVAGATGWAGDAYAVYKAGGQSLAVARITFTAKAESEEFGELFRGWLTASSAAVTPGAVTAALLPDGRAVRITAAANGDILLLFASDKAAADRAFELFAGG